MASNLKLYSNILMVLASLLLGFQCKNDSTSERPNIVWIIAEDIGPALGCYGDSAAITPNIDKMAAAGLVYDKVYAVAPICSPSRSTLATGLYPTHVGTHPLRSETIFPDELKTMPELFREAGYFTSLFGKTDYNFDPVGLWEYWEKDEKPWNKRKKDQPFLSVFTLNQTHEGRGNSYEKYMETLKDLPDFPLGKLRDIVLPPAYPQTEEARLLWSRYYDLITVLDHKVGTLLKNLEDDGLMENTIVFFFSDHGFGMPGFKRWLNEGGLKVPLVIYVPDKFKYLVENNPGSINSDLVSFADFVPTALGLAGIDVPDYMQGSNFANIPSPEKRKYVFASRDRADNAYELSRAIRDERYMYIRNYMPHLPAIQIGKIFSNEKEAYALLHRNYAQGTLPEPGIQMYRAKDAEELYDLTEDPWQLVNLATLPEYDAKKESLKKELQKHIISTGDLAFLPESEINLRARGKAPWYLTRDKGKYNIDRIFNAAQKAGFASEDEIEAMLNDPDSGVKYWGIIALWQLPTVPVSRFYKKLHRAMMDKSPSVSIAAAEWLYHNFEFRDALQCLLDFLDHEEATVRLEAARAIELLPLANHDLKNIQQTIQYNLQKYKAEDGAAYPYSDYNFASFISWSLESLLMDSLTTL
ncbi:MAG: sulfatase-like hydrolase/transferase [Cyclobacteriaceae bacterium]|nr:sulfatase-like hydrolase/transferase [Cyclobacteriaceae bacterium]